MAQEPETKAVVRPLRLPGTYLSVETRQLIYGLVVVLLVTMIGMLLSLQGWKSRAPAFDMVTYFNSAESLLKKGIPAHYGDISSYGSFSPPGTTWLMVPGMLLFNDPRLYEKFGSALLHLGTLVGVFLLARQSLGIRCAYLSVILYGLSGLGLSFAGSLWPIGHPFFYVWMAYFAIQWVTCRDAKYLAAAIATWAGGMYVDMAITPAVLTLPALWLIYRAPLFSRLHLIAAAMTLAVWYPYLQFEMSRGFADLKSQFLRHSVFLSNYKEAWCDPKLTLKQSNDSSTPSLSDINTLRESQSRGLNILDRLMRRGGRIVDGLLANFHETTPSPGIGLLLLLLVLSSIAILSVAGFLSLAVGFVRRHRLISASMTRIAQSMVSRAVAAAQVEDETKTGAFVLSLVVPWLILLVVAEPGRPERFFWIWPLQAIALAAFIMNVMVRLRIPSPVLRISQMMFIGAVLIQPIKSHLEPWLRNGWAGSDPEEVQVVDYVANQLRSDARENAAVGYQIFIYPFMANYKIIDRQYKVGAEFDLLFKYRHGIGNTDQCAEGVSPADEYRIVQTRPKDGEAEPRHYFEVPLDKRFRLLRSFDLYRVYKRD